MSTPTKDTRTAGATHATARLAALRCRTARSSRPSARSLWSCWTPSINRVRGADRHDGQGCRPHGDPEHEQRTDREPEVTPQPVDTDRAGPPGGMGDVADGVVTIAVRDWGQWRDARGKDRGRGLLFGVVPALHDVSIAAALTPP